MKKILLRWSMIAGSATAHIIRQIIAMKTQLTMVRNDNIFQMITL
jgi:hypothetical protein